MFRNYFDKVKFVQQVHVRRSIYKSRVVLGPRLDLQTLLKIANSQTLRASSSTSADVHNRLFLPVVKLALVENSVAHVQNRI